MATEKELQRKFLADQAYARQIGKPLPKPAVPIIAKGVPVEPEFSARPNFRGTPTTLPVEEPVMIELTLEVKKALEFYKTHLAKQAQTQKRYRERKKADG